MQLLQDQEDRVERSGARPLPRLFGVLGYAIFSMIVLAALLELTSWAGWSAYRRVRPVFPELRQASPVYDREAWAAEFWREELLRHRSRKVYVPFRIWATTEWHGKYINNDKSDGGVWRRTVNPSSSDCSEKRKVNVWMFGGSTLYGTGVPDGATIPSYLSRSLNAAGSHCTIVTNEGVEGYVSNQELLQLMERLKSGAQPDIVVFYDGVNDASAAGASPGPPSAHFYFGTIKNRIEGSLSGRLDFLQESYTMRVLGAIRGSLHRKRPVALPVEEERVKAASTLDNYEANLRLARALSRAFNFELYWFWQPSLYYGHKPVVPFEKNVFEVDKSEENVRWSSVIAKVYEEAERRAAQGADFIFLGDLFDSSAEPVYLDEAHLGPRGNELVAQSIAKYIETHSRNYLALQAR
jgi:lysophospholipase L1-like esterase